MNIRHGDSLKGVDRCPQCGIATPLLQKKWWHESVFEVAPQLQGRQQWGAYECTSCKRLTLAEGRIFVAPNRGSNADIRTDDVMRCYPEPEQVSEDVPPVVKKFLEQALQSLHVPDGAVMLANSAVDAMLKNKGLKDGSVYMRIDQAVKDNILTQDMAEWAHKVRLDSNKPRHADEEMPHATESEARQSVEFAQALAYFLFELTARIARGKEQAGKAA